MATQSTRVAIYARTATQSQDSVYDGLARQERACRVYATAHGYVVAAEHVYCEVMPGTARAPHPGLDSAVAAIERGELAGIVTASPDRVSRDPARLAQIERAVRQAGGRLEYVQGGAPWFA